MTEFISPGEVPALAIQPDQVLPPAVATRSFSSHNSWRTVVATASLAVLAACTSHESSAASNSLSAEGSSQPAATSTLNPTGSHPEASSPETAVTAVSTPATANQTPSPESLYPTHRVVATIFWVGEGASDDNAGISNAATEWDPHAAIHFGGIDDPDHRKANGLPAGFVPRQNPYYVALPASEFDDNGLIPGAREHAPWYNGETSEAVSVFKGHWVEITSGDKTIYAQWMDTGPSDDPNAVEDYGYVFGPSSAKPKNTYGLRAGIDLSPTAAIGLGVSIEAGSGVVTWRFVASTDVPEGPWTAFPAINDKVYD